MFMHRISYPELYESHKAKELSIVLLQSLNTPEVALLIFLFNR